MSWFSEIPSFPTLMVDEWKSASTYTLLRAAEDTPVNRANIQIIVCVKADLNPEIDHLPKFQVTPQIFTPVFYSPYPVPTGRTVLPLPMIVICRQRKPQLEKVQSIPSS